MEGLRVTIRLCGPIKVSAHPIHLDAVLAALRVGREEAADEPDGWSLQHDLPLERYVSPSGQWVFKAGLQRGATPASWLPMFSARSSNRRVAEDRADGLLALRASMMNPAGGPFKASIGAFPTRFVKTLCADAVGDVAAVRNLLGDLRFLGGKRSLAMGRVASVEVTPVPEANWSDRGRCLTIRTSPCAVREHSLLGTCARLTGRGPSPSAC